VPQDQLLLTILGLVVFANVLLVALIPLRTRGQRRPSHPARVQPGGQRELVTVIARPLAGALDGPRVDLPGRREPRSEDDARAAAAIEAFVAEVSPDAAGRTRSPAPSAAISEKPQAFTGAEPERSTTPLRAMERPDAGRREPSTMPRPNRSFAAPAYAPAGLADPAAWDRTLREETARVARFGRPVTVVMAEIPDLDGVVDRLGPDVADRVVTETARVLVTKGRAADRIAWLGDARFGILLSETEEVSASGYVDRVRAATDGWLESAGLSVRLSLGWASPAEGADVMAAAATAQQRMRDVERRSASEASRI
jgi:diguanylate cyclase (GGDEF)-like protein